MRVEQLTFTRFIAAISIVIYHYGTKSFLFNNELVSFIFRQANLGVSYFFILSGFVMTIAYFKREKFSTKEYLINRVARIYPLYVFAIFLFFLATLFSHIYYKEVILNLSMLQSWVPHMALSLNYPSWSLSVEVFFYLCFPVLFYFIKKFSLIKTTVSILSFWLVSQVIYHLIINEVVTIPIYSIRDISYHPLFHLNEFLIGILTGIVFLKFEKINLNSTKNTILIFINIILILAFLRYVTSLNYHNGLLAILFAPLIYLIATNRGQITKAFTKKPLVYLGEISFGIYLLQAPVWMILSDSILEQYFGILQSNVDNTNSFLIRMTALLFLAAFMHSYFENPLRDLIKKLNLEKSKRNKQESIEI